MGLDTMGCWRWVVGGLLAVVETLMGIFLDRLPPNRALMTGEWNLSVRVLCDWVRQFRRYGAATRYGRGAEA